MISASKVKEWINTLRKTGSIIKLPVEKLNLQHGMLETCSGKIVSLELRHVDTRLGVIVSCAAKNKGSNNGHGSRKNQHNRNGKALVFH